MALLLQIKLVAQVELMVAVAVVVVVTVLAAAQEALVLCVFFGPVVHVPTHQQIQVICNETFYTNTRRSAIWSPNL
jgi:hypothetical protein